MNTDSHGYLSSFLKHLRREWCCMGFEGAYRSAGDRGFSVLTDKDETFGVRFSIQSRAVSQADQARFQHEFGSRSSDYPVSTVAETGLQFCPWCGVNLKRFYEKRVAELDRPGFSIQLS